MLLPTFLKRTYTLRQLCAISESNPPYLITDSIPYMVCMQEQPREYRNKIAQWNEQLELNLLHVRVCSRIRRDVFVLPIHFSGRQGSPIITQAVKP